MSSFLAGSGSGCFAPGLSLRTGMPEAPTLVAGLHDVAVVREPVEQRGRHLFIDKHTRPLREAQVGGDHHAGAFIQLGQQMKQQRPA